MSEPHGEATDRIRHLEARVAALEAALQQLLHSHNKDAQPRHEAVSPFRVLSANGRTLCEISGDDRISVLHLYNASGEVAVSLASDGQYNGVFVLRNSKGAKIAYLHVEQNGTRFLLQNEKEEGGVALFAENDAESGGGIHLLANEGEALLSLWASSKGGEIEGYDRALASGG